KNMFLTIKPEKEMSWLSPILKGEDLKVKAKSLNFMTKPLAVNTKAFGTS
ncbi:Hypothetical predicted protein, partial [Paramuricea clavata]